MTFLVYLIAGVVLAVTILFGLQLVMIRRMQGQKGKPAPELTGEAGKVLKKGRPALFYFHSPQCGACRRMTPLVQQMSQDRKGVFSVDISRDMATARSFGVLATPTTVFVQGGVVQDVLVGPQSESKLLGLFSPA